jgi:hypothetical protein
VPITTAISVAPTAFGLRDVVEDTVTDPTNSEVRSENLASAADPSPSLATQYRDGLLARLAEMGWSTSAAAETGLSTTVMINDQMIGASVDMNALFDAADSTPQTLPPITVFAFSPTTENPIPHPTGTVVRRGTPTVTVARHRVLDLLGCEVEVPISTDLAETTTRTIAALAASVEHFHALVG